MERGGERGTWGGERVCMYSTTHHQMPLVSTDHLSFMNQQDHSFVCLYWQALELAFLLLRRALARDLVARILLANP